MKRSRLLTHWTGRDICTTRNGLTADARAQYMTRMFSLLNRGFWMTIPPGRLVGRGDERRSRRLSYQVPMTCFTELRLSTAQSHHRRYGFLGVVVDRTFVLDRWGAPVHYVRSTPDNPIVENAVMLLEWLKHQLDARVEHADTIMTNIRFLIGFMKNMSDPNAENFLYLDKQEWRIVHCHTQQEQGRIVATGQKHPRYLLPVRYS